MSVLSVILLLSLILVGFFVALEGGMQLPLSVAMPLAPFLLIGLVIALSMRFARWLAAPNDSRGSGRQWNERSGDVAESGSKVCPDPHCRRINIAGARFCAQCGRPFS